jgi:hypothetical protein
VRGPDRDRLFVRVHWRWFRLKNHAAIGLIGRVYGHFRNQSYQDAQTRLDRERAARGLWTEVRLWAGVVVDSGWGVLSVGPAPVPEPANERSPSVSAGGGRICLFARSSVR